MAQGKQAKILSEPQIRATTQYLATTRNSLRDTVIFLLSVKSGLRAKEIASLAWQMVTDPEGNIADAIALQNIASKGKNGGRTIPLNKDLKQALETLKDFAAAKRAERICHPWIRSARYGHQAGVIPPCRPPPARLSSRIRSHGPKGNLLP